MARGRTTVGICSAGEELGSSDRFVLVGAELGLRRGVGRIGRRQTWTPVATASSIQGRILYGAARQHGDIRKNRGPLARDTCKPR